MLLSLGTSLPGIALKTCPALTTRRDTNIIRNRNHSPTGHQTNTNNNQVLRAITLVTMAGYTAIHAG